MKAAGVATRRRRGAAQELGDAGAPEGADAFAVAGASQPPLAAGGARSGGAAAAGGGGAQSPPQRREARRSHSGWGGAGAPRGASLTSESALEARLTRLVLALWLLFHGALWGARAALERAGVALPLAHAFAATDATWPAVTPSQVAFVHVAACITFAVAFILSLSLHSWSTHPVKRALAVLVSLINWVAFATYAAQVAGAAPALGTRVPGDAMQPFRFLQWAFTTPLLICALTSISGDGSVARGLLLRAVACDWVMLAAGFAERYALPPGRAFYFALSSAAFCGTMAPMAALFRLAAGALSAPEDAASLNALWRHTLTMWCLFPAARGACLLGLLGPNAEETVMALLDVAAKTGYSIVLMAGTFTLVDQTTERRLERAEELLTMIREHDGAVSSGTGLADGLTAAYREAEAWRAEREARMVAAGVPDSTAAAFLDAAVGEYVALAQGRLDAWGLPTLRPPA